jgi:phosphopantothenoylcysteine synthetase/decarboxylase
MHCVVTAGPTYEPLDDVRRLTNFSTGRLGSELATYLTGRGHATYHGERHALSVETFSTTANLRDRLRALAGRQVDAVFHAAAVSDFTFGKIWKRSPTGEMSPVHSGKISTREGTLLAELAPTPKIIAELRQWLPKGRLVGWKYEVEGDRAGVIELAKRQISECHTDGCVANGPAYGRGFGLVRAGVECLDLPDTAALFQALAELVEG